MSVKDERSQEAEKTEFPVDTRPLIGSFILLAVVFVGLCALVYFQNDSDSYSYGNILLALVFAFAAYVQRGDSFRMAAILITGGIVCLFFFLFGGGTGEGPDVRDKQIKQKPKVSITEVSPEGFTE